MIYLCRRIGLVQSSIALFTQKRVPYQLYFTILMKKMEAINTLKDLGYAFNTEGKLRQLNENGKPGDKPFQFNISDDHQTCQAHYEAIGNAVTQYVYYLLETEEHLTRLPVPKDIPSESITDDAETDSEGKTFIFATQDYDKKDTLLVLIHGSGVVRAGQWARSLIINKSLNKGTQIPYIKKAIAKGYGVLVMNTNDNYTEDGEKIRGSESPERHGVYVWENYVLNSKAENILIVAHSYGGVVAVNLADKMEDDFTKRVKAIAFTDSVHGFSKNKVSQFLKEIAKNWIGSSEPLDTPIQGPNADVPRVSAGHEQHEMTSCCAIESVFKFFDEKLTKKLPEDVEK